MVGFDGYALENRGSRDGYFQISSGQEIWLDHNSSASYSADAIFGYGIYKLELYFDQGGNLVLIRNSPIILDYRDLNYAYGGANGLAVDLHMNINYNASIGDYDVTYRWHGDITPEGDDINLWDSRLPEDEKSKIKCYKQYHRYVNGAWQVAEVTPNTNYNGISKSDELLYPINGTEISDPDYQIPSHDNPGLLLGPLYIQPGHNAKVKCGKTFTNNSLLFLNGTGNNYAIFTVADVPASNCNAVFVNNPSGTIAIPAYATFEVKNGGKLFLENQSHLTFANSVTSNLNLRNGSYYCNKGADISRPGHMRIEKGVQFCIPNPPARVTITFSDSAQILLDSDAVFVIPDSTTYVFEGNQTALICSDSSIIKFGKNAKLVFSDGARIKAKHTKFTTVDSNTTWDGIYLNDFAFDTLQYCTIENALNGINKEDLTTSMNDPATEISNCTFSNKTSTELVNMIYVNGGRNVMIRNCSSSSLISTGFQSGIIIEYSDAGGVSVIDNNLSYTETGISVIQSSPYIARNTITGAGTTGYGLYLDNSNGTIEYNIIDNFDKSILLYYSSPYILKNTFSDANTSCVDMTAFSVPVMRPIISGSTLRWLAGNNYLSGSPSDAGFTFVADAYPLIDSGYNVTSVGASDYMQGTLTTELKARVNNWQDDPPESNKFNVEGESVDYSEYFNGTSLPGTDYYDLYSIGFGYYDTVHVKNLGDNPTPEDLFIQAYLEEMARDYYEAITLYKEVISTYKTSNYAISSLSRIFNCLEKSNAGNSQYLAIKSYYDGLKTSNNYPIQVRELAEDLAIKSKVRMGFIEDAISDYQSIINNNPNTPKGIHAQVNKLVLENMNSGGDNTMFGSNQTSNQSYKENLLAMLTGDKKQTDSGITNNVPKQFRLYQNYPNPFNPVTTIRYDIPAGTHHGVFVQLRIYDVSGKEVLSITEEKTAGSYSYVFDGTNLASGVYFYRIEAGNYVNSKKMLLIK